jgi:hypothetical protein
MAKKKTARKTEPSIAQTKAALKKQIEASIKIIAAERDKLRDLTADAEQLADDADGAISNLESAVDTLSQTL